MRYDFLVVGAGLFGATVAHELNKKGYKILVVEKRNNVAGNIYTAEVEGIQVHKYGPHIFHTSNKETWDYINQFAKFNDFINTPLAYYKGKYYNMPFNMNTFEQVFGVTTPSEAKARIEKEIKEANIKEPKNLEEKAISMVGTTIYEMLVKGYTQKQWGKACNELPPFIITRLPVRYTYNNNYFNDIYQGIPIGGYTQIVEKMLKGIEVRLNVDYLEHYDELNALADHIIYTGEIDRFFGYQFGALEWRSLRFEEEIINQPDYQGNAVVNYTEYEIPYTRIVEHQHFEPGKKHKKTIITKEYSKTWSVGDEAYYPINDERNSALYSKYAKLAEQNNNLYFGGRLGTYSYYNMDVVVEKALKFVEQILNK
ncbi:MAG TPA: UDP-galactopyranose mutase [Erysipelotrichaceae bacterium]|nr:UDP-galactopyranose mutase [Erysipelotrichaceae bacterium]